MRLLFIVMVLLGAISFSHALPWAPGPFHDAWLTMFNGGDVKKFSEIIKEHPELIYQRDDSGMTLMHYAFSQSTTSHYKILLDAGADVNVVDKDLWTPLHYGAKRGFTTTLQNIINKGAKIDVQNINGETPLYLAVNAREMSRDILLRNGANPNIANNDGNTPLHGLLTKIGDEEQTANMIRKLLAKQADQTLVNNAWDTPIALALKVHYGPRVIQVLLDGKDVPINRADAHGDTPLIFALRQGYQTAIISAMLAKGADVKLTNDQLQSPLFVAGAAPAEVWEQLLTKDAAVNAEDVDGRTPLFVAAQAGQAAYADALLAHGATATGVTLSLQQTTLMAAVQGGKVPLLEKIIALAPTALDTQDAQGNTALHLATNTGNIEIMRSLLEHKADPNVQNVADDSPLHLAARDGNLPAARLLLANGADRTLKNAAQKTALDEAINSGNTGLVKLLQAKVLI
ncbi:MAG: ankyrin repeat domain-containing protein [bacterium]